MFNVNDEANVRNLHAGPDLLLLSRNPGLSAPQIGKATVYENEDCESGSPLARGSTFILYPTVRSLMEPGNDKIQQNEGWAKAPSRIR